MKRFAWLIPAIGISLLLFLNRSTATYLIDGDSDTSVMLAKIAERGNPASWFWTDWPLENKFYRPISTLTFELDRALYGTNPSGFALTNAILAILCVWSLLWLVWELSQSKWTAAITATLFGTWMLRMPGELGFVFALVALLPVAGLVIARQLRWQQIGAVGAWVLVSSEVWGMAYLKGRTLEWIPGRTATLMTCFALAGLALLLRFLRASANKALPSSPTALDMPATKSSVQESKSQARPWVLFGGFNLCLILAQLSYEQGMTVAALAFALALAWPRLPHAQRFSAALLPGAVSLLIVLAAPVYAFRVQSTYQEQQSREGVSMWIAWTDYVVPPANTGWVSFRHAWDDPVLWLTSPPWAAILVFVGTLAAGYHFGRSRWLLTLGYVGSCVTFLPMATLKPFEHYHVLPMAFRAMFVVGLIQLAAELTVSAVRRPTEQAPPRLDPAPGSLPRP